MRRGMRAAVLALLMLTVAWPLAATAHTDLVDATPRAGAVVDQPVEQVTLDFGTALAATWAQVVVQDGDGVDHVTGEAQVRGSRVIVDVDPLDAAGTYQVAYRVVGEDGHPVTGGYQFKLSAAAARTTQTSRSDLPSTAGGEPTLDAAAAASTAPSGSAPPAGTAWGPWLIGVVALVAMMAYGARARVARTRTATRLREHAPV